MNGKKRKATKSDTADGKMVRKNSKNLDGMNPTRLIKIIGPKQARNKIRIVSFYFLCLGFICISFIVGKVETWNNDMQDNSSGWGNEDSWDEPQVQSKRQPAVSKQSEGGWKETREWDEKEGKFSLF